MKTWNEVGVHSEKEAREWERIGIDIKDVFGWKIKFMYPNHAEPWKHEGFTSENAWRWYYLGFTPLKAREWLARGFDVNKKLSDFDFDTLNEENDEDMKEFNSWNMYWSDVRDAEQYKALDLTPEDATFWETLLGESSIAQEILHDKKKIAMILMEVLGNKDKYEKILKRYIERAE